MKFNNESKNYVTVRFSEARPVIMPVERDLISVPGLPGGHLSRTNLKARRLEVPINVFYEDFADLQNKKKEMAEWLYHESPKPLIFNNEPDKTYYALLTGEVVLEENVKVAIGNLSFICPDPYVYGLEQTLHFPSDQVIVNNEGTAEADPIFELTATKKSTFAMVSNENDEYNLIGQPADVDVEQVDSKTTIVDERGDSLSQWNTTPIKIDSSTAVITGDIGTDGTGVVPLSYGSGLNWHGPAQAIEIDPIQDFEVEMFCRVELTRPSDTFRIETYLFDENLKVLGKIAIVDSTINNSQIAAEGRQGDWSGVNENYPISSRNYQRNTDHFHGLVRMTRQGNRFVFYVARLGSGDNPVHHDTLTVTRNITDSNLLGRLKYIQIHFGKYGNSTSALVPRINRLKVAELKEVTVDQTPYILDVGDVVMFDHKNDDILINGEPRKDLKNFGASFFTFKKGENQLLVTPENSFETKVRFREKFY